MATIMLSIKPQFSKLIFDGSKTFELRKHHPSRHVDKIIFYETRPTSLVVGEADCSFHDPCVLFVDLHDFSERACVSPDFIISYYGNRLSYPYYSLSNPRLYSSPIPLSDFFIKNPPLSLIYLD